MAKTITKKILAPAAGHPDVTVGEEVCVRPDLVLAYDWPGGNDVIFHEMKATFAPRRCPNRSASV